MFKLPVPGLLSPEPYFISLLRFSTRLHSILFIKLTKFNRILLRYIPHGLPLFYNMMFMISCCPVAFGLQVNYLTRLRFNTIWHVIIFLQLPAHLVKLFSKRSIGVARARHSKFNPVTFFHRMFSRTGGKTLSLLSRIILLISQLYLYTLI